MSIAGNLKFLVYGGSVGAVIASMVHMSASKPFADLDEKWTEPKTVEAEVGPPVSAPMPRAVNQSSRSAAPALKARRGNGLGVVPKLDSGVKLQMTSLGPLPKLEPTARLDREESRTAAVQSAPARGQATALESALEEGSPEGILEKLKQMNTSELIEEAFERARSYYGAVNKLLSGDD